MKKGLTSQQMKDYESLCKARSGGKLLTPDGLRFICEANGFDPMAIGKHFLNVLPQVCPGPLDEGLTGMDPSCPYYPE